jgi:hypothetical protein
MHRCAGGCGWCARWLVVRAVCSVRRAGCSSSVPDCMRPGGLRAYRSECAGACTYHRARDRSHPAASAVVRQPETAECLHAHARTHTYTDTGARPCTGQCTHARTHIQHKCTRTHNHTLPCTIHGVRSCTHPEECLVVAAVQCPHTSVQCWHMANHRADLRTVNDTLADAHTIKRDQRCQYGVCDTACVIKQLRSGSV